MGLRDSVNDGIFTDFYGTIVDGWCGTDANAKDPNMLWVYFKLSTDDIDRPEHIQKYECGKGWVTEDMGETMVLLTQEGHRSPKQAFNRRWSRYGKFIDHVADLAEKKGRLDEIDNRVDPYKPATWAGMSFHFNTVDEGYKDKESGQWRPFMVNYPDEWVTDASELVSANGQASQASESDVEFVAGLDPDLRTKLEAMARKSASVSGFGDMVLVDAPEITDRAIRAMVTSAGVWEVLRG